MRTLVYKRTHIGDPDESGEFGCNGCMGRVRSWPFEAVIEVGGLGAEPIEEEIAYKITWIGIGPHKRMVDWWPDPIVTFNHFVLYDRGGNDFRDEAPILAKRIYDRGIRATMNFNGVEWKEVGRILSFASIAPPSPARLRQLALSRSKPQNNPNKQSRCKPKLKAVADSLTAEWLP